eukprot:TRINITY_DN20759_c0_g1_i1.p1 TRINITY_DN20759_c0_g1~~TRINITY_DN20759_c0_g1_i1.p1  ORF type:complete len:453 (+),score=106.27 TRINITY_DN20759_c0_g1_i1:31-1359(+)
MAFRLALVAALAAHVSSSELKLSVPQQVSITAGGTLSFTFNYAETATPNSLVFDVIPIPATMALEGLSFKVTDLANSRVQPASSFSAFIENTQYTPGNANFQIDVSYSGQGTINIMVVVYEAGSTMTQGNRVVDVPSFTTTDSVTLPGTSWRGEVYVMSPTVRTSAGFNIPVSASPETGKLITLVAGSFPESSTYAPTLVALAGINSDTPIPITQNPSNYTFTVTETTDVNIAWTGGSPMPCAFKTDSGDADMLVCKDAVHCNGTADPTCCKAHNGIQKCMEGYTMCATPDGCDGDYCCMQDCGAAGQYPRPCGAFVQVDITDATFTPAPGGSSDSSMSGGGVFLVLFFTFTFTYCIFGVAFNYSNGARGCPELLPQYRFWMEIPKLMSEGLDFLKAKVFGTHTGYAVYSDQYAPAPFETEQRAGLAKQSQSQGYGTGDGNL